ncbi:MAG: hypothetical protein JNK67_12000 [Alphaproteobacteria bacterium]|nr:hypothetical protein [Alphaproteobacteria bacterium]
MSEIVEFLRGKGRDGAGRRLSDIWAMNDAELERSHDYIQWLFPLDEPSGANPGAPVLAAEDVAAIRKDQVIRANIRRSLDRMLGFFGFAWGGERRTLVLSPYFPQQAANWLSTGNHNFLRMTRILRCLVLVGEPDAARALLAALEAIYKRGYSRVIGPRSLEFWQRAVEPPAGG